MAAWWAPGHPGWGLWTVETEHFTSHGVNGRQAHARDPCSVSLPLPKIRSLQAPGWSLHGWCSLALGEARPQVSPSMMRPGLGGTRPLQLVPAPRPEVRGLQAHPCMGVVA